MINSKDEANKGRYSENGIFKRSHILKKNTTALLILCCFLPLLQACIGNEDTLPIEDCPAISYPLLSDTALPISQPTLHVDGEYIKDQFGRVVLLRGVNTSGDSKVPPFTPLTSANMLDPLPAWGINTLRLLFTWEAFEPNRCHHETAYLDYYESIVEWAKERDIYVIVDFHQDAFSRFSVSGCGEGFPEWAVSSTVEKKIPDNGKQCETWGTQMIFDWSHHKTWAHFHGDTEGAKTRYIDMVTAVSNRMSSHTNVIGYELINEPWGTNEELANFYEEVGSAIRSRHPSSILFVPPHALVSSGGVANNIPKPTFDNFVYSPHYYDPLVILSSMWLGTPPAIPLDKMADKARKWGVPLLIGEFGAPANTLNVEGYMEAYYQWLNQGLHSATQWNYTPTWNSETKDGWNHEDLSIVDNTGSLRENFVPRPYPQAIAGTPKSFETGADFLELSWLNTPSIGNTTLYIPAGFADDKQLATTANVSCQIEDTQLQCTSSSPDIITIRLE